MVSLREAGYKGELVEPVEVALADGRLNRAAVGWARQPIQRCHLAPGVSRAHAWSYWCVTGRAGALSLLVADVGIAGAAVVSFLDFAGGAPIECVYVRPLGLPVRLSETPLADFALRTRRLEVSMQDLRLRVAARTFLGARIDADLVIGRPPGHESVNVVVPWDDERFHFTSKHQGLPVEGVVRIGGREHRFDRDGDGFACLDFGRGRRPRRIDWGWAFASGRRAGRTLGLNLGATWTDGTGVTENALVVDGRVHKIDDAVDIVPAAVWDVRTRASDRVALRFRPRHERALRIPLGLASLDLRQCFGSFSGTVADDGGAAIAIQDLIGVAESFHGRWM